MKRIIDENRRKFFRLDLSNELLNAEISIASINGKVIITKENIVKTENISASGMAIITNLDFPLMDSVTYKIRIKIVKENIEMFANIVRKEISLQGFRYGLEFILLDNGMDSMQKKINAMSGIIKKNRDLLKVYK